MADPLTVVIRWLYNEGMQTTKSIQVPIALAGTVANYRFEGPTQAQARKMATRRQQLLTLARTALAAGNDDQAFEYDAAAFDIETDLVSFGFGKLVR